MDMIRFVAPRVGSGVVHRVIGERQDHGIAIRWKIALPSPGNSTPVTFTNPGNISVICAIHPSMKMSVKVTD